MKIAVVGCGAVGSYYGARLTRAGHEVHFLLRSDYDVVRRHGVHIESPSGDFTVRPRAARLPEEIGPSDLVLVALKTTANGQFPKLLPPLVCDRTGVITLQNGLGNEEELARLFPIQQILGGLCFVCLNRIEPGVVRHLDHGLVVIGEFQRWPEPRTHDLASAFRHAGVPCHVSDDLARAHWEKLTWNIPFNGLGVAGVAGVEAVQTGRVDPDLFPTVNPSNAATLHSSRSNALTLLRLPECLPTSKLLGDERWAKLVRELMLEVIASARALGFKLPDSLVDKQIERTLTMGAYKASTLLDFERGSPLELNSLFLEPLRQARNAEVSVPRLESLCRVLQELDSWRQRSAAPEK